VSLSLPGWARPFAPFIDMMGTPDANEVNPALMLPVTVSLLFGYMFPDVGHGLVLALLSGLLYRRWPQGRFLVPCGLSAAFFGLVFGEVFGVEGLVDPLWISPLQDPLLILLPPLFFGVLLMLLGLVFNGIEAHWRNERRQWLLRDAPVLLIYVALSVALFIPAWLWLAALGLLWFLLGQCLFIRKNRLRALLANLALLLQSLFELLLSSFSFIRVGAFALGHAALTSALLQIVEGIHNPLLHAVFLLAGHLFIILLEGLVVFVQTSRLVLFEFFVRFLKAEGRILRPLPAHRPKH
jgi:V/A-type H+-transporting ATPase subunit I